MDDFFCRRLNYTSKMDLCYLDPVRKHLSLNFRQSFERDVFGLFDCNDNNIMADPHAIINVAYCRDVPKDEIELARFSQGNPELPVRDIAVFYTVWSTAAGRGTKGSGREMIIQAYNYIRHNYPHVNRFVTLSPLTEMAEKFHLANGAVLIGKHSTCQNFEYYGKKQLPFSLDGI